MPTTSLGRKDAHRELAHRDVTLKDLWNVLLPTVLLLIGRFTTSSPAAPMRAKGFPPLAKALKGTRHARSPRYH
jgi:hypothetical protein